jgi:hypothetical protein
MIPPIVLPAMAVVALLEAEEDLGVPGVVISSFFVAVVECEVAVVVLEVLCRTLEGHESAFSSSKVTSVHVSTHNINYRSPCMHLNSYLVIPKR